jgi:hypothetical protein
MKWLRTWNAIMNQFPVMSQATSRDTATAGKVTIIIMAARPKDLLQCTVLQDMLHAMLRRSRTALDHLQAG